MYIEKLELKGFIRIALNSIEHIIYTPTEPVQIILGTNGCGKSSLLSELSPLPAKKDEYTRDGFKKIWINHQGRQYYLESAFKPNGYHCFVCDGEELNPGHTSKIQSELVRDHFNWTEELHELLTGITGLTAMSPSKRREWITRLSSVDFSYALQVYQRLATQHRDAQGAFRHVTARLAQETQKLKALNIQSDINSRIQQLRTEVNALLTALDPNAGEADKLNNEAYRLHREVQQLARQILEPKLTAPAGKRYSGLDDVGDDRQRIRVQLDHTRQLLERCTGEYSELETLAADLGQIEDEIPEDLDDQIIHGHARVEELQSQLIRFHGIDQPSQVHQINSQILNAVITLFMEIPDGSDGRYDREHMEAARARIEQLHAEIGRANTRLMQIEHRRGIINAAKESTCPSCGYIWREGFSERELVELDSWEAQHTQNVKDAQAQLEQTQQIASKIDEVMAMYARFRGYVNNYPLLRPLWDHLLTERMHRNEPNRANGVLSIWASDTLTSTMVDEVKTRLKHLELLKKRRDDGSLNHLAQRRDALTQEIEVLTLQQRALRKELDEVERYYTSAALVLTNNDRLLSSLKARADMLQQWLSATRNDHLNQAIYTRQDELSTIQRQASEQQTLEGIVRDLERSRAEVEMRQLAFNLLAEALSPTEGLIADDMSGFITCLVDQMNAIIASVWTYDLLVYPCTMESGELNYKFPLYAALRTSDIARGSLSQQDVVNFAFRLVAMLYLKMSDVPLYLDEPASGYDEQHRINMMQFIKQLMDAHQHPQMFMVSHYDSNHGSFTNAQTLVLSSFNIAVPDQYNEHVVLV